MKNSVRNAFAILTISALTLTSCFDLTSNATDAEASLKTTLSESATVEIASMPCGFDNRATTAKHDNQQGVIAAIPMANQPEGLLYVITIPGDNQRFSACNMPESLKKDGLKIMFSGEVKEIMPEERWVATPYKLSAVKILE